MARRAAKDRIHRIRGMPAKRIQKRTGSEPIYLVRLPVDA